MKIIVTTYFAHFPGMTPLEVETGAQGNHKKRQTKNLSNHVERLFHKAFMG